MGKDNNEIVYMMTMVQAKKALQEGLITKEEYCAFETKMKEEYHPKLGGLFSRIDLL